MLDLLAQTGLNAVYAASYISLIAVGLVLIFGVMGVINFAHGELYMAGAYSVVLFYSDFQLPFLVAVAAGLLFVGCLGLLMERALFRPLRDNPLVVGYLVDASGEQAMVWIEMEVADDFDARRDAIVASLRTTAAADLDDRAHHLAGTGVLYTGLNEVTEADFGLFLGIGVLVLFTALGFAFRSVVFGVAALLVVR